MPKLVDEIRVAAFDLDGTLVDTVPDLAAAGNALLATMQCAPLPQHRVAAMVGDGIDALVAHLLAERDATPVEPAALRAASEHFRRLYRERLFEASRVYPGVVEGLRALDALDIALCCVTNKHSVFTQPLLDAAGLSGFFAAAFCADQPARRKPAPDLLLDACRRFGARSGDLLYVGDSRLDIAAARAAHCRVAVVDYGYSHVPSLADANPDWIIGSIAEVVELSAVGRSSESMNGD